MSNLQAQLNAATTQLSELVDEKRRVENSLVNSKKQLVSWTNGGLVRTANYNNYKARPRRQQDAATLQRLRDLHIEAQNKVADLRRTIQQQENTIKALENQISDKRTKIESLQRGINAAAAERELLAGQGISLTQQETIAEAEADVIRRTGEEKAARQRVITWIAAGVGVLLLVLGVVLVRKRIKKK